VSVPPVLGSRASDTLSGLGPEPVRAGDIIPVGPPPADFPNVDQAPTAALSSDTLVLRALRGPRDDWLADPDALVATQWTASSRSDRVGMRLVGEPLQHHVSRQGQELPSEGVVRGSIQVPPAGEPVVFLADHPVTGGYPVVAVLVDEAMDQAAQAVPGQQIRIVLVGPSP
jgi:allophanate hydrolase subunit 2